MRFCRALIGRLLPRSVRHGLRQLAHIFDLDARLCWGQEGEDIVLRELFAGQKKGFYVDVGAHHPTRYSNTYYFYTQGWRGLNIDAMPGSMKKFIQTRPRDINVEAAVSKNEVDLVYHIFNIGAVNTFDEEKALEAINSGNFKLISKTTIRTRKLIDLLNRHLPAGTRIDFMSVDVEGLDLDVLESNDWEKYRPRVILIELQRFCLDAPQSEPAYQYLIGKGYKVFSKLMNTVIFTDATFEFHLY